MSIPGSINPLFLGAAGQATGGGEYQIERSLRFNSSDSAYCSRVFGSPTDAKRQTYSFWVKRTGLGQIGGFPRAITNAYTGGSSATGIYFDSDSIYVTVSNAADTVKSTAVFRDASAWYHFVVAVDTTQATASNRVRIYVNGAEITSFSVASYPALNAVTQFANSSTSLIGTLYNAAGYWFDGMLAEFHFIDGQALTPSSFGEFDTNGVWQPIAYEGSYGTNGFHLPFSDNSTAAALGTDTSGNGNDWTPVNFSVSSTNYLKDFTGTPFNSSYSLKNMFDGSTSTYMTPISGTWAVFEPSAAIPVTTFEVFGGWSSATASLAPKVNDVDVTNAPLNAAYQWFTPTLSGGVPITSLSKFEFYTASGIQAFLVSAIRINGTILISNPEGNDSLVDSPTNYGEDTGAGGEVRGNYATLNPLLNGNGTPSDGNLLLTGPASSWGSRAGTVAVSSGKWYFEVTATSGTASQGVMVGITKALPATNHLGIDANGYAYFSATGNKWTNGSSTAYGATWTDNDVIGCAFDADAGTLTFYKNGTSQGTAYSSLSSTIWFLGLSCYGTATAYINFGQRPFAYTAPSGFKALCTTNLPEPTIADGSTAMDVALWAGSGAVRSIAGLNFSPDLVWIKARSIVGNHFLFDIVRGATNRICSSLTNAEASEPNTLTAFNSDGFSLGTDAGIGACNLSGQTYVAWTWDAGSSTVTNTQGSITSQVRANASAGFSVVTYTGTLASVANNTVGHGLNVAPKLIMYKNRSASANWHVVMPDHMTNTQYLNLNSTNALLSYGVGSLPDPTSSVIYTLYSGEVDVSGNNFVAYCFAPVSGYSSFGSYTGNGSADGPFVYTGFRPKFVLFKAANAAVQDWVIYDTKRDTYNVASQYLFPNASSAEAAFANLDFLSNGFKLRSTISLNTYGYNFIYAAFAEHPFATSRAR